MTIFNRAGTLLGLWMSLITPGYVVAEDLPDPTQASGPTTVAKDDLKFLAAVTQIGMTEIHAATIAQSRAMEGSVKAFATEMDTDHRGNDAELEALAVQEGITLPTQLDKDRQELLGQLQSVDTAKFDATYAKVMTAGQKDAIALFEKAAKDSKDRKIREFAIRTLPMLQHHLEMARQLRKAA